MDRSLISDADKATGSANKMVAEAALAKSQGNELFSAGKYAEATAAYTRALQLCGAVVPATEKGKTASELRVTLLTNRAAAALKDSKFDECISDCTAALEQDGTKGKALYRRAEAHAAKDDIAAAFRDARRLLQLEPKNKAAGKLARRLKEELHKEDLRARGIKLNATQYTENRRHI